KKLLSAADGASLAAADSFGVSEVDSAGGEPQPGLTAAGVKASAQGYLERSGAAPRFNQLALDSGTGAPDAQTARVVLTAVVHPPVVNFLVPAGIPITAVAEARPTLTR
ncbi:hypothetical protein, partial [Arthrobacter sp. H5]|uniref:hypothetical protein n=1 Tax=Arthrobacter sp. H5 TaxID=1267973 RepID=UPI000569C4B7